MKLHHVIKKRTCYLSGVCLPKVVGLYVAGGPGEPLVAALVRGVGVVTLDL